MPIYEYECSKCEHCFDVWSEAGKNGMKRCPVCKGKATKVFHAPGLIFRGSGWHVTDYGGKKPVTGKKAAKEKKTETTSTATKD